MGKTEIRKKAPGPEPISTGILKSQRENEMSSEAQVFSRQGEEKSEKNTMGGEKKKKPRWVRTQNVVTHPWFLRMLPLVFYVTGFKLF